MIHQDFALFAGFDLPEVLRATLGDQRLEGGVVNFFSFVDVDRAAYLSV